MKLKNTMKVEQQKAIKENLLKHTELLTFLKSLPRNKINGAYFDKFHVKNIYIVFQDPEGKRFCHEYGYCVCLDDDKDRINNLFSKFVDYASENQLEDVVCLEDAPEALKQLNPIWSVEELKTALKRLKLSYVLHGGFYVLHGGK